MRKLKIIELFGGIGACSKALERLGIDYEITDYVEIDKYAVKSFNAIHNTNFEPQDICKWDKDIEVDLIMHGSPCVDFSLAGKQAGGDKDSGTRSSLMYETIRIVEKLKPKYVIWENVKNLLSKKHRHNFDAYLDTMENLGYTNYYQVLNAKDYGVPQNRERVFTISILGKGCFNFPSKQKLNIFLQELLDKHIEEKYFLSKKGTAYVMKRVGGYVQLIFNDTKIAHCPITANGNNNWTGNFVCYNFPPKQELKLKLKDILEDVAPTQSTYCGSMTSSATVLIKNNTKQGIDITWNDIGDTTDVARTLTTACRTLSKSQTTTGVLENNLRIRKLTPKECWRLMGFDDED